MVLGPLFPGVLREFAESGSYRRNLGVLSATGLSGRRSAYAASVFPENRERERDFESPEPS